MSTCIVSHITSVGL